MSRPPLDRQPGGTFAHARALAKRRPPPPPAPHVLVCPACGAPRTSPDDLVCRSCGGRTTE